MPQAATPQSFFFETTGSPGQISQAINNYINGWINIQPTQGLLQDLGTTIGHQMSTVTATGFALRIEGETDVNNTWFKVTLFDQPKVG